MDRNRTLPCETIDGLRPVDERYTKLPIKISVCQKLHAGHAVQLTGVMKGDTISVSVVTVDAKK